MPPSFHSASSSFRCRDGACPARLPLRPSVAQPLLALVFRPPRNTTRYFLSTFNFKPSTLFSIDHGALSWHSQSWLCSPLVTRHSPLSVPFSRPNRDSAILKTICALT